MKLVLYPEEVLRVKCSPLREIDDRVFRRAQRMLKLMYEHEGLGLAGPQVGWSERIVTLDADGSKKGELIFVNPRIVEADGEQHEQEGCLSIPGIWCGVRRSQKVLVEAYTIHGKPVQMEAEGLVARAWQHEIDHLNGVLFIDRLPPTALFQIRSKLKELEQMSKP